MIKSLLVDSYGTLWIGAENGLQRLVDGQLEHPTTEWSLPNTTVIAIVELPGGEIVAATADQGLLIGRGDQWHSIGESEGLPPEQLIDIEVRGQNLWLVTGAGIFRTPLPVIDEARKMTIDARPIAASSAYRGELDVDCCRGHGHSAAVRIQDRLLAASDDGVVVVEMRLSETTQIPAVPYLKTVTYNDVVQDYAPQMAIQLEPDHNELFINYSAIHLARGPQVEFRYRVAGLNEQWIDAGKSRRAHIQNLPPGEFLFELQASSTPGVWSTTTASLSINRSPHLFETAWFRMSAWVIAVLTGLALLWLKTRLTRLRHQRLEASIHQSTAELKTLNSDLQATNLELEQSSQTDPLTRLVNRRFFDTAHSNNKLSENVAAEGLLMMIDIDFFKRVNDSYGHATGDDILRQFADVLRSVTRQSDLVARWGGEEFVLICGSPNDAKELLERICSGIRNHHFRNANDERIEITCSLGCIRYPLWGDQSLQQRFSILLEFADAALYTTKMNGRDGWALLERGAEPTRTIKARRVGPKLAEFIARNELLWCASRPEINPANSGKVITISESHAARRA